MDKLSQQDGGIRPNWTQWMVNCVGVACFLSALAAVVAVIGWQLSDAQTEWVQAVTKCAAGLFLLQEVLRMVFRRESIFSWFRQHWCESALSLLAMVLAATSPLLVSWLIDSFPKADPGNLELAYDTGQNALILWVLTLRAIRSRRSFFRGLPLTPGRVFILSFVLLIAAGTLLLKTPNASVDGISWCDALFLSTSAVCVTGLAPFDIALELTFHGQCIVLGLIQMGGLGVMSITYFFAYFFAGGLSLKNRFDFQDLFSEENMGQIGTVLAVLVGFTFIAETVGAIAIYCSTAGLPVVAENPVFFSIFHSVSGFCNAGLSCVPGGMANPELCRNTGMIFSVFFVVVVGGLGFPVVKNFWVYFVDFLRRKLRRKSVAYVPVRLTTHTKLVVVTSIGLLLFGMIAFYFLDWDDWGVDSIRRAFFLSGTSRTAGFDIGPTADITPAAKLLLMVLMFIGGSPFSTAGGIKTTTFAVAVLSIRQYILGRRDLTVFRRRLSSDVANQALAIVLLGASIVFVLTVALNILHPEINFLDLAFEAVSAVGTVGLSCDVTPKLGDPAKYFVICAMFIGRIGVLLFVTSFLSRRKTPLTARLPETTIVLS